MADTEVVREITNLQRHLEGRMEELRRMSSRNSQQGTEAGSARSEFNDSPLVKNGSGLLRERQNLENSHFMIDEALEQATANREAIGRHNEMFQDMRSKMTRINAMFPNMDTLIGKIGTRKRFENLVLLATTALCILVILWLIASIFNDAVTVVDESPEEIKMFTGDHLGLLISTIGSSCPSDRQEQGSSSDEKQRLAKEAIRKEEEEREKTTAENVHGRYEETQIAPDDPIYNKVFEFTDDMYPAAVMNRILMTRGDDVDASEVCAALKSYSKVVPPPTDCLSKFECWVASGLVWAGLAAPKKRPPPKKKEQNASPNQKSKNDHHGHDPSHQPPAHPGAAPVEAAHDGTAEKTTEATDHTAARTQDRHDIALNNFFTWIAEPDQQLKGCPGYDDDVKGTDTKARGAVNEMYKVAAEFRTKFSGTRKGEPLEELHTIQCGARSVTGSRAIAKEVIVQHILKSQCLRDNAGLPTEMSREVFNQIKDDIANGIRFCRPYRVSTEDVREFLRSANRELQGPLGVRMKIFTSFDDELLGWYCECANKVLSRMEPAADGSTANTRTWTAIFPLELRTQQIELLGKGGVVTNIRKVRCVVKSSPALRILSGTLAAEVNSLAEKHDVWNDVAFGGRPGVAAMVALMLLFNVILDLQPKEIVILLGLDNSNYFNCLRLIHILNCLRWCRPHPIVLAFYLLTNWQKLVIARNGRSHAATRNFSDGIQGASEVMLAGTALQVPSGSLVLKFLRYIIHPTTQRLSPTRIAEAKAALEKDRAVGHAGTDLNSWAPYDPFHEIDDHYLTGDIHAPTARSLVYSAPAVYHLDILLATAVCLPLEKLPQVVMYVDDKVIGLKVHEDDQSLLTDVLAALNLHEVEMLRKAGQYLAKSKLEVIIGNPTTWTRDVATTKLEGWAELLRKHFCPFGTVPEVKSSTVLLGALFNLTRSPRENLWSQIQQRLSYTRYQVELVEWKLKSISGSTLRLLTVWGFLSPVLHLLPLAQLVFSPIDWAQLHFDLAWNGLELAGFSRQQIDFLMEVNKLKRQDLFRLFFSEELLSFHDLKMMATKVTRATSARVMSLTDCKHVADLVTTFLPVGPCGTGSNSGFDDSDKSLFQTIADADSHLHQRFQDTSLDLPTIVPTPVKNDPAARWLRRQGGVLKFHHDWRKANGTRPGPSRSSFFAIWCHEQQECRIAAEGKIVLRVRTSHAAYSDFPNETLREKLRHINAAATAVKYLRKYENSFSSSRSVVLVGADWEDTRKTGTFLDLWGSFADWREGSVVLCRGHGDDAEFEWVESHVFQNENDCPSVYARALVEVADRETAIKWPKRHGFNVFYNPYTDSQRRCAKHRRAKVQKVFSETCAKLGIQIDAAAAADSSGPVNPPATSQADTRTPNAVGPAETPHPAATDDTGIALFASQAHFDESQALPAIVDPPEKNDKK
eukprot:g13847.t1